MLNFTIPVPDGTTNHGNPNLLCLPPQWTDYVLFYIGNYFAHAATIMLEPGNSAVINLLRCTYALAFPLIGIVRAVDVLILRPGFARGPLEKAARSRALSRKWWDGYLVECKPIKLTHGAYYLPNNFALYLLPPNTPVHIKSEKPLTQGISNAYSMPKIFISLAQLLWTITTLYRARGDQIQHYGYAAFGLTVSPFAWMSFLNLIGNSLTPTYETVYLVQTPSLKEAEDQGGEFLGVVGEIDLGAITRGDGTYDLRQNPFNRWLRICLWGFIGLVPLAILGGMSKFAAGHSTVAERAWIMSWIVVGWAIPVIFALIIAYLKNKTKVGIWTGGPVILCFVLSFVPVIGGFVVVGRMLRDFGVCRLIG
ncbi:hypothetical protein EG329_002874 [Mollisiaceae sp. DMI_Dod_QoI]|nr:hypothetical protein EG329_002874 [Helotiales sp. DMI_Dod_QoI]